MRCNRGKLLADDDNGCLTIDVGFTLKSDASSSEVMHEEGSVDSDDDDNDAIARVDLVSIFVVTGMMIS